MNQERIYADESNFFFNVRGNTPMGPYDTFDDAQAALNDHVERCRSRVGRGMAVENPVTPRTHGAARSWHPLNLFRRSASRQS